MEGQICMEEMKIDEVNEINVDKEDKEVNEINVDKEDEEDEEGKKYKVYIDKLNEDLILRGSSQSTINLYTKHVRNFLVFTNKEVDDVNELDVRKYLLFLNGKHLSKATINNYQAGIRFFFAYTLNRAMNYLQMPRMKEDNVLPVVLTRDEIDRLLDNTENIKYKAMFALGYGSGLRISEVISAHVNDIDSKEMTFHVQISKRNKDRHTVLSQQSLQLLRQYWRECKPYNPDNLLFPGNNASGMMSEGAINGAFKRALDAAGIQKPASFHSLRHSFATHLLEDGTDLFTIKELLGHSSISSTAVYLHLANVKRNNATSPADRKRD